MKKSIEERVQTLENRLWVGLSIGAFLVAFFGIGGDNLLRSLHETQTQLSEAQQKITELKKEIPTVENEERKAVDAFNNKLADTAHEAVTNEVNAKIGAIKSWVTFSYCEAKNTRVMNIGGVGTANGAWQQSLIDDYEHFVLFDKPIPYSNPVNCT